MKYQKTEVAMSTKIEQTHNADNDDDEPNVEKLNHVLDE